MNERPQQPPEGKLLADALEVSGLSIREASRRAGLSYGRWRQITSGVQNVSPGSYAKVTGPAKTVARMAAVVGITPQRLGDEGERPDAAEELEGILLREGERRGPASPAPAGNEAIRLRLVEALDLASRDETAEIRAAIEAGRFEPRNPVEQAIADHRYWTAEQKARGVARWRSGEAAETGTLT